MNKTIIIIAVALIGVFTIIYFYSNDGNENLSGEIIRDLEPQTSSGIKEFTIIAKQWEFDPSTISVNEGDIVRLKITSIDVVHGIAIPEYKINEYLSPGQTVSIEFIADRKGTFPFACSVSCGIGHSGMSGKIIVN